MSSSPKPIFISHAFLDEPLVTAFVNKLLKVGCGLTDDDIFYSSGAAGVRAGRNLMASVQNELAENTLVIAIISPNFQTRPVCIAELGAAWATTGKLLPIAIPEMDREDMEGVLKGMVIHHLDDTDHKLDEIHERVGAVPGIKVANTGTWNAAKAEWLIGVKDLAAGLPTPDVVTPEQLAAANANLAGTQAALAKAVAERNELAAQIENFNNAGDDEERREALRPKEETERFKALLEEAQVALHPLERIVIDAFYGYHSEGGWEMPRLDEDQYEHRAATKALKERDLVQAGDDTLIPNMDIGDHEDAATAIERLSDMLDHSSDDFREWFRSEHGGLPPKLSIRKTWDRLLT